MIKPKLHFWLRLFAALIDAFIISCLSYFVITLATLIPIYISFNQAIPFTIICYLIFFQYFKSQTPGKIICGIIVYRDNNKPNNLFVVILREVIGKIIIILILPAFVCRMIYNGNWVSPYYDILAILVFMILLLSYTIIVKRVPYDQISKTNVFRVINYDRKKARLSLMTIILLSVVTILIKIFGFSNADKFIPMHNSKAIEPYTQFIKNNSMGSVDYIFNLFKKYDIVVLCERMHPEYTQWNFIYDIVSDKRFINQVGNISTEYGVITLQPYLDNFMNTPGLSDEEVNNRCIYIMRNMMAIWPIWTNTNFHDYLKKLYQLNLQLPDSNKVHHYFSDVPFSWDGMTKSKYDSIAKRVFPIRDKIMANNIIQRYETISNSKEKRKKCLVIMNYRHAFNVRDTSNTLLSDNTCTYIFQKYPNKTANVLLNSFAYDWKQIPVPIQNGKWDEAFEVLENPSLGFDFSNSPFGRDNFDLAIPWSKYIYEELFNGFVFYMPLNKQYNSVGVPGLINNYYDTLLVRAQIKNNDLYLSYQNGLKYNNDTHTEAYKYDILNYILNSIIMLFLLILAIPISLIIYLRNVKTITNT